MLQGLVQTLFLSTNIFSKLKGHWCHSRVPVAAASHPELGWGHPGAQLPPQNPRWGGFGVAEGAEPPRAPCAGLCPHLVTATRKDRARVAPGQRQGHGGLEEKGEREGKSREKRGEKKNILKIGTKREEIY